MSDTELLVRRGGAAEDSGSVGFRDRGLTDSRRGLTLCSRTRDAHFIACLQRVRSPSIAEKRVGSAAFDFVNHSLAARILRFDVRIDVRVHPFDLFNRSSE